MTLGRRETAEGAVPAAMDATPQEPEEAQVLGLTVSPINEELRETLELTAGTEGLVITEVDEMAEAYEKGLRAGDVITEAGQQKVTAVADLQSRIEEAQDGLRVGLERRKAFLRLVAVWRVPYTHATSTVTVFSEN